MKGSVRMKIKVGVIFGNPETTPGGRALKFYSTIRLEVRKAESIKMGDQVIGSRTNVKIVKNKVAPPFKTAQVEIMYGTGVSRESDIIEIATDIGILEKSGAWYAYNGEKIGQGKENVKNYLKEHTDVRDELEYKVREHYNILGDMKKKENKKSSNDEKENE